MGIGCSLGHLSTFRGTAPVFLDLGHAITPFLLAVVRSFHRSRSSTAHVRAERADEPNWCQKPSPERIHFENKKRTKSSELHGDTMAKTYLVNYASH
jgi:hypothetical protein